MITCARSVPEDPARSLFLFLGLVLRLPDFPVLVVVVLVFLGLQIGSAQELLRLREALGADLNLDGPVRTLKPVPRRPIPKRSCTPSPRVR